MPELDRYALVSLGDLVARVTAAYDDWKYHAVYRAVYDYCTTDLSAFYLDVLKDRLYADAKDSHSRRSAQTVLANVLTDLVRLVAPILSFTAEEVWQTMPAPLRGDIESVHLAGWPVAESHASDADLRATYGVVLGWRDEATRALEVARNESGITKSQAARLTLRASAADAEILSARGVEALAEMFIVSAVTVEVVADGDAGPTVRVEPADGEKCPRCWNWRDLGTGGLCARCSEVIAARR